MRGLECRKGLWVWGGLGQGLGHGLTSSSSRSEAQPGCRGRLLSCPGTAGHAAPRKWPAGPDPRWRCASSSTQLSPGGTTTPTSGSVEPVFGVEAARGAPWLPCLRARRATGRFRVRTTNFLPVVFTGQPPGSLGGEQGDPVPCIPRPSTGS